MPRKNNDTIIHLIDYKSERNHRYSMIYADFRTDEDFRRFVDETGMTYPKKVGLSTPSAIEINNLTISKRLIRDSYYKLNISAFKKSHMTEVGDSYLFCAKWDFKNAEIDLFSPAGKLDLSEIQIEANDSIKPDFGEHRLFSLLDYRGSITLRVNQVGQANHNDILNGGCVKLVYDIGAPINASNSKVDSLKQKHLKEYEKDKPILIISHWDFDHFHQLCSYSNGELDFFSYVICCDYVVSRISQALVDRIKNIMAGRFAVIHAPSKPRNRSSKMLQILRRPSCSVYQGEYCSCRNYSGIVVFIRGKDGFSILTGDCNLSQVSSILNHEICLPLRYTLYSPLLLVVPHHGGEFNQTLRVLTIPYTFRPCVAIISVDAKNNPYGHPKISMLKYLAKKGFSIFQTDRSGGDIVFPF